MTTAKTITREELAQLEVRRFDGPVCLVANHHDLDRALSDFRHEKVVGLDTETQPTFHRGQHHLPSLVQVATAHAVYLFQLKKMDFAAVLTELLENPAIIKAGVALDHDLKTLKHRFLFEEKNVIDLGVIVKRHGIEQTGVRNLTGLMLGFRVTKGSRTSNWGRAFLSPGQVAYAATDAWVCRELYLDCEKRGWILPKQAAVRHPHNSP